MKEINESLALEMLRELKNNSKRWFIIAVIELLIILGITGIFVWYINQPVEEVITYEQEAETEGTNSPINQKIGEW